MLRQFTLLVVVIGVSSPLLGQTFRFAPEFRSNWLRWDADPCCGDNPNGVWTYGSYHSAADAAALADDLNVSPYPLARPDALPVDTFLPYTTSDGPAGLKAWTHGGLPGPIDANRRGMIAWRDEPSGAVWSPGWGPGPHWEDDMVSFICHGWRSPGVRFTAPTDGVYNIAATFENRNVGGPSAPPGAPTDIRVIVTTGGTINNQISLLSREVDVPGEGTVNVPYSVAGIQVIGEDPIADPALSITDDDIADRVATELDRAEGADGNRDNIYAWPQERFLELGQDPNQGVGLSAGDTIDFIVSPRNGSHFQRAVGFEATLTLSGLVEGLTCERLTQGETMLTWTLPNPVDALRILRDGIEMARLDPTSTSYTDAATPARAHTYQVEATWGGTTEGSTCTLEDPSFGAISGLVCARPGDGESVTVSWTNNGPGYDTLSIQINAEDPIVLDPDETQFVDSNVPAGPRGYRVAATWENDGIGGVSCSSADPRLEPPSDLICIRQPNAGSDDDVDISWTNNGTGYDSIHIFLNDIEKDVLAGDEIEYFSTVPPGDADFEIRYTARVLSPGPTCRLTDPDFPDGTRFIFTDLFAQSIDESTNPIDVFSFGAYTGFDNENPYPLATPTGLPVEFFVEYNSVGNPAGLATWSATDPNAFGLIGINRDPGGNVWNPGWSAGPHWEAGQVSLQCNAWASPTVRVEIPEDGDYFINASFQNRNAGFAANPPGSPTDIRVIVTRDGSLDQDLSVLSRTVNVPGTGDVEVPVTVAGFQSLDREALGLTPIPDPRLGITDQDILDGIATELDRAEGSENNRFFLWPQDLGQGGGGGLSSALPFSAGDTLEFMASPRESGHFQRNVAFLLTVQLKLDTVPASGACCDEDGNCSVAEDADCVAGGGVYQGNGTTCDTVICPVDTGACCVDGVCSELGEEDCLAVDGASYNGDGSLCGAESCPAPTGACCLDGVCSELNEEDCLAMDGATYNGDESTCGADTCPAVGQSFRRGDCDQSGKMDFNDAIFHLKFLFLGENEDTVNLCRDACDSDDSGADDFTDDINTLKVLFLGQGNIADPGPLPDETHPCGTDPTLEEPEELTCETYAPTITCP